ncbi:PREDICTED: uncharacterized protein LOC106817312 isoform X2 [Priapulus caudatus]|uniref:Uncharacterized protein LOC106817312 isoform X2 n=1 Tax=Priapulus caudatus TaxID=37621 RepID=A0ABM1EZ41_PRICU|nr:PREDICTED: uncharacterized protein LOC106817312 isoform X2 [Priapulus caudatus]
MVLSCWIKGCRNRADGKVTRGFYTIPIVRLHEGDQTRILSEERRRVWLANINRKNAPSKYSKVCSDHFVKGKPADLYDRSHPDWAPTLLLADTLTLRNSHKKILKGETDLKRYNRIRGRSETREKHSAARTLLDLFEQGPSEPEHIATPSVSGKPCTFRLDGKTEPPNHKSQFRSTRAKLTVRFSVS